MNQLVKNSNGELLTTSKIIADSFNKTHRDVIRALNNLDCSDEFRSANFAQSSYMSPQNKKISCFDITRDGFAFLCMGFTGKKAGEWKEKYIQAFNKMESHINNSSSVMAEINNVIKILEEDKAIASNCARGLSRWRKIKKAHETNVKKLIERSQMVLGFESLEQLTKGETK